jgi:transposase-like protein
MNETILPCPKCKAQRVHTVSSGPDINGIKRKSYTCTKCNLNTLRGRRGEVITIEEGKPATVIQGPRTTEIWKCPRCETIDTKKASPITITISGLCDKCHKELLEKIAPIIKEYTGTEG